MTRGKVHIGAAAGACELTRHVAGNRRPSDHPTLPQRGDTSRSSNHSAGPRPTRTLTAQQTGRSNAEFQSAEIYTLSFADNFFDRIFSHALIEHLSDPIRAAKEMFRVLKPGGSIGVCSPDWGGFVLAPPSTQLTQAIAAYTKLQTNNGGDVQPGRKLGKHLKSTGFEIIQMSARYECYDLLAVIGKIWRCNWNALATAVLPRHFENGAVATMACSPNAGSRAWLASPSSTRPAGETSVHETFALFENKVRTDGSLPFAISLHRMLQKGIPTSDRWRRCSWWTFRGNSAEAAGQARCDRRHAI